MKAKVITSAGGCGFCGFLVILFIGLKLTGKIGWSWWWVLSPLWVPWALAAMIFVVVLLALLCGKR
jgi:hypothetical protein